MRSQFVHADLGQRKRGDRVQVTLRGNAANVMLLDASAFSSYKAGRKFRYVGGMTKRSPVVLTVPRSGRWHGVVDVNGLGGRVRASFKVLPNALPPLKQGPEPSLTSIRQTADSWHEEGGIEPAETPYDVFISHATEDKDGIVRDLAAALTARGLNVWYDETVLRIGDNLRRKIDAGLASSRFGVVVLSRNFFAKNWPQYELDGLVSREMGGGHQLILPIWHDITKDEVMRASPSLVGKVALRTSDSTVDEIADEITDVVGGA
jgi:hypothetical protein